MEHFPHFVISPKPLSCRFANSLSEKENEIKRMFQDLEEATKLSTFWEKECHDLKAANAQQVLARKILWTSRLNNIVVCSRFF